jgi:hypothetical protein
MKATGLYLITLLSVCLSLLVQVPSADEWTDLPQAPANATSLGTSLSIHPTDYQLQFIQTMESAEIQEEDDRDREEKIHHFAASFVQLFDVAPNGQSHTSRALPRHLASFLSYFGSRPLSLVLGVFQI